MSSKSIVILILLSGFVCFGMPEFLSVLPGAGIAQAQDDEANGQRLVRDLEDALKSGDQARIRQAQERVNAHQYATRILAQRPVLKLQVKMAISQAPAATPTAQTLQSQTQQKQTLTTQTRTLQRSGGLSTASSLQGTVRKEASPLASSKTQGLAREGMAGRLQGLSSAGASGAGPREIQSFSSKPEGVSREGVSGVSSVAALGEASEVGRGVRSMEQTAGVAGDIGKGVATAAAVGSGVAAPGALGSTAEVAGTAKAAAPEPPAPARRITPAQPVPTRAASMVQTAPVAAAKPQASAAPAPAPAGYAFSPATQPKIPEPVMIEARTGSGEAVKMSGTKVLDLPKSKEGANTRIGPPDPEPKGLSIQDILKQMADKEPPSKTDPFGIKMPEGKTVQTSADAGKPVDPTSTWTDVMKAGKGETPVEPMKIVKGDPDQAKLTGPTAAQLGDQKMNYVSRGDPSLTISRSRTGYDERVDAYGEISAKGERQIGRMPKALESGKTYGLNPEEAAVNVKEAAMDIRTNPRAVQLAKELPPEVQKPFQEAIQSQRATMTEGIKQRVARMHNLDISDSKTLDRVEVRFSSNPGKATYPADDDVSVLIDGKQVKAKDIGPIVQQEAMKASKADQWYGASDKPENFAKTYKVETMDRHQRHAFGGSAEEGQQILGIGEEGKPIPGSTKAPLRDPPQLRQALADKTYVEFQEGDRLSKTWSQPQAEAQYGEGYRQLAKDYQGIIEPKVKGDKAQVPSQVQKGMEIVNKVGQKVDGRVFTPADADEALRQMGETRETITDKATSQIEAQNLKPPGQGRVSDQDAMARITKNVTDELELKKMRRGGGSSGTGGTAGSEELPGPYDDGRFKPVTDAEPLTEGKSSFKKPGLMEEAGETIRSGIKAVQGADQQLAKTLGVGALAKDASRLRSGLNKVGGYALGAYAAYETGKAGLDVGIEARAGLEDYLKARELSARAQEERKAGREQIAQRLESQAEWFTDQAKTKGYEAGKGAAAIGGGIATGAAIGALAPTAGAVAGGAALGYAGGRSLMENTETGRWLENKKEDLYDGRVAEGLYQARLAVGDQVGGYLGDETEAQRKQREYQKRQETYLNALQDGRLQLQEGASAKDVMDYIRYNDPTQPDYREGLNSLVARAPAAPPAGQGQTVPADPAAAADKKSEAPPTGSSDDAVSRALNQMIEEKPTAMEQYAGIDGDVKPVLPEGDSGTGANLIGKLRDAERGSTAGQPTSPDSTGIGGDSGMQVALGFNMSGSFQQDRGQQLQQEAQQAWGSIGGAQAERTAADQNRQMVDQSRVQAQGQQTNNAIAANAQEFSTAQQTLQVTRQNSLGNIVVDAFMGGITTGTAVGINTYGSIVSSAMAQQVSVNWGIAPATPMPMSGTPSTTGTGSASGQTGGAQTAPSSTDSSSTSVTGSTGSQTSGGQTVSPSQNPPKSENTKPPQENKKPVSTPPPKTTKTGNTKTETASVKNSCPNPGKCTYTSFKLANGCCKICGKKVQ
jgi:hypothetical protein